MVFTKKLKLYRKDKHLTQQQLADLVKMSRTTITELEGGKKKPTFKVIERIAAATQTKTSDWLDAPQLSFEINKFDGLELLINKLYKLGEINDKGEFTEKAERILLEMLSIEALGIIAKNKNE